MPTLADDPLGQVSVSFTQGRKAVAAAGTPETLVAADTFVEHVEIHARKNPTTANAGAVYVGVSSAAGSNYRVLLAGEYFMLYSSHGKKINLKDIWVDAATNADAVTYTALN